MPVEVRFIKVLFEFAIYSHGFITTCMHLYKSNLFYIHVTVV